MFLRSVNELIKVQVGGAGARYTSVVYDGPPVQAALVFGRVNMVHGTTPSAVGMQFAVRKLGDPVQAAFVDFFTQQTAVGDRMIITVASVLDLVRGDVLECWLSQSQVNRWSLEENGFSIVIR